MTRFVRCTVRIVNPLYIGWFIYTCPCLQVFLSRSLDILCDRVWTLFIVRIRERGKRLKFESFFFVLRTYVPASAGFVKKNSPFAHIESLVRLMRYIQVYWYTHNTINVKLQRSFLLNDLQCYLRQAKFIQFSSLFLEMSSRRKEQNY